MSSATGHTPGPWSVTGRHGGSTTLVCREDDDGAMTCIAQVEPITSEQANARLIAAAPALLAALEELVAERSPGGYHDDLNDTYGLELARAAISEAQGPEGGNG